MILSFIYPRKCVLCQRLLHRGEQFLCPDCFKNAPEFGRTKRNIPFVAHWTALWYYKENVPGSILRFKFGRKRVYATSFGELLSRKLIDPKMQRFDILSWVPVSTLRSLRRGFDQSALIARVVGKKLDVKPQRVLRKIRHTPPQSSIRGAAKRRANVRDAYKAVDKQLIAGKRILLIDDVVTTGATASECARTLLTAGAKEVIIAAVAAADKN